jgi:hypothetical protein
MWRTVRGVVVFFTIGETNPRYWAVTLATWFAFIAPAVVFANAGVSPPFVIRIIYSLAVIVFAGASAARAERRIRRLIGSHIIVLPLILMLDGPAELWLFALLALASFAAFRAGLAFGLRERRPYLADEFEHFEYARPLSGIGREEFSGWNY